MVRLKKGLSNGFIWGQVNRRACRLPLCGSISSSAYDDMGHICQTNYS